MRLRGEQRLSGDGAEHCDVVTANHDIAVSGFLAAAPAGAWLVS